MYYVYILVMHNGQLYTGFTADLRRRVREHLSGKVSSTKGKYEELIHYEAYKLESDARRRERFLKTTEGKRLFRQQIRDIISQTNSGRVAYQIYSLIKFDISCLAWLLGVTRKSQGA